MRTLRNECGDGGNVSRISLELLVRRQHLTATTIYKTSVSASTIVFFMPASLLKVKPLFSKNKGKDASIFFSRPRTLLIFKFKFFFSLNT